MSVAVLGEALIDFIVGDDGAYRPHLGGSPYNVAIGLARQGIDVNYLSAFSDDIFGDQLRDSLIREEVAVPVTRRSLWPTSLALVTVDEQGLPTYRLYREGVADKDTSYEEIEAALPADIRVRSGTQTLCKMRPQLDTIGHAALRYSLGIGVTDNKIYTFNVLAEHMVYCIAASATYTNHFDDG